MLVVVHEYGHFIAARRNGVDVEEFGIGFPPKAWGRKMKSGFIFTINWLPLGGFVKLKGEHDSDTAPHSFGAASLKAKTKIMLAGIGMNFLVALVLFTVVAAIGMPRLVDNQFTYKADTKVVKNQVMIAQVESDSPAKQAKLEDKDQLLSITGPNGNKVPITSQRELQDTTKSLAGQKVSLEIKRDGQTVTAETTLRGRGEVEASLKTNDPKGYLGIAPVEFTVQRSTWSAPIVAVGTMAQLTALTFQGIGHALHGLGSILAGAVTGNQTARVAGQTQASQDISGPVGIFYILKESSQLGLLFILFIIAYLSLALAIMNLLPIPALDGGRLYLTLGFRAAHKPLKKNIEENVNFAGFVILMVLIVLVTVVDIRRIL